jgi:hypothetical protein
MKRILLYTAVLFLPLLAHAQSGDFFPLLPSLPGISTLQSQDSLAPFLSQIYKICIGLAAVLAVLQMMAAGVMYMGGDSITEKKEARNRIGTALAGLLLVLSPAIVFGIINPKILNLEIGADRLKSADMSGATGVEPSVTSIAVATVKECTDKGGTAAGNPPNLVCTVPNTLKNSNAAYGTCSIYDKLKIVPEGASCNSLLDDTTYTRIQISNTCCYQGSIQTGFKCCGVDKKDLAPPLPDATTPIHITKAYYEPVSGNGTDYGIVSSQDRDTYVTFGTSCDKSKGKLVESAAKGITCTAAQIKDAGAPASYAPYVICKPVTVSCKL